MPQRISTSTRR